MWASVWGISDFACIDSGSLAWELPPKQAPFRAVLGCKLNVWGTLSLAELHHGIIEWFKTI